MGADVLNEQQREFYRLVVMKFAGCQMQCPVIATAIPDAARDGWFMIEIEHKDDGPSHRIVAGPFPPHAGVNPQASDELVRLGKRFGVHALAESATPA